jgi:hypothetical protein
MMHYKIVETDGKFVVLEKPTNIELKQFQDKEQARVFLRHLNFGGGFDGWTPAFMQQKYFFDQAGKLVTGV